jgi:hypothetical protein
MVCNIGLPHACFRHFPNFFDCFFCKFRIMATFAQRFRPVYFPISSIFGGGCPADVIWIYTRRIAARMRGVRFRIWRLPVRKNANHTRRKRCRAPEIHYSVSLHSAKGPLNASTAFCLRTLFQKWERRIFRRNYPYWFHKVWTVSFPPLKVRRTHTAMRSVKGNGARANRDGAFCHFISLPKSIRRATGV